MNRLRDMGGDEPLFRRGSELLRSVTPTATTTAPATEMKQRVWRSLQHAPAAAPRGLPILMLKVAIVAIVALGAGTAGAVIAQRWIVPRFHSQGVAAGPARPIHSVHAAARPERTILTPPVAPPPIAEPVVETPPPKPAARPTLRRIASAAPSAAAVARERTEVLDALVALRREHDPARAGTLLARYLSAHPRGAMREEALALAIEAADARGERAAAAQLAQAYQTEFPAGRFLIFARSHIDRANSH
jgi:hypothetical protein